MKDSFLLLQFRQDEGRKTLELTGRESYVIEGLEPGAKRVTVVATVPEGREIRFQAQVRIDTPKKWEYYRHGGILHYVLRDLAESP